MVFSHLLNFTYMKHFFFIWAIVIALLMTIFTSCVEKFDANGDKNIYAFKIVNLEETIEGIIDLQNADIRFTVPYGVDMTALKVDIELGQGAICEPASGTIIDFTNEVLFTVTAEDRTSKQYRVSGNAQQADFIYDFESLALNANSFWSGPDTRVQAQIVNLYGVDCEVYYGSFSEQNAEFSNTYNATWYAWSGFAYSNLTDTLTAGYTNQYSVYSASGYNQSANFAIAYAPENANPPTEIVFENPLSPQKVFVNNSAYSYLAMKNGDAYTQAFAEGDFLKLEIIGYDEAGNMTNTLYAYLADFTNNHQILLKNWTAVDLSSLGRVKKITFALKASQYGVPTYFCLDNLEVLE
jgi:hypothetical protein